MNKLSKTVLMSLILSGSTFVHAAGDQGQGSGQVKFHGYIINSPCSIVSDDPIQVEFGQISNKVLQKNTNTGESHIRPFQIELADCSFDEKTPGSGEYVGNNLSIKFSYTSAADTGPGVNYVGLDGVANSGVGIVITSGNQQVQNNTPLKLGTLQSGPNTLEFASYVKGLGDSSIMTGEFYANANFTLSYQ
ncbi:MULTISPECIES: fimbrial protein [unclassified Acinetobacter]|uniref:fimbrial protein n=1 Tax=unclassified Acinetobacter TaxID=196816 RepID=UPI00293507F4|nr:MULTISPECIES: fimbrial protein [unclassified Acinetobacter]WOE31665.1 fimbrial protein [Acinetobacter sp. SAAs470]WOE37130.1 fimbrial protein [Acinetobacter sp. SAAs474]